MQGMHGYDPDHPTMKTFIIAVPAPTADLMQSVEGDFDILQVHDLVSHLMHCPECCLADA